MKDIKLYSNPVTVLKRAKLLYGDDVQLKISTRKDKKYQIWNPEDNKWVHFGQMLYEDFTKTNDEEKRKRFLTRNHKWKTMPKYSPAYLSYHLLW